MVLADTSIWIDHFVSENPRLTALLDDEQILMHPMVIGELACGNLANRDDTLFRLKELPASLLIPDYEVLSLIERHRLMGRGISYIDAHLLASVALDDSALLWTRDRRLRAAAVELDLAWSS